MLKSGCFSYAGTEHEQDPGRNEDVVAERDCGGHKLVVLCDGASGCTHGKAAARLTAGITADFLASSFRRCLLEPPDLLRRELSHLIAAGLASAALQTGASPDQFGCTLMAAAIDELGRWCMFHLGDGTALGKLDASSDWLIVSYPQRGLVPGRTSLTSNASIFHHLRFYRQDYPAVRSLFLATDGAMQLIASLPGLLDQPELLSAEVCQTEDDCSAAWLTAGPEPGSKNAERICLKQRSIMDPGEWITNERRNTND